MNHGMKVTAGLVGASTLIFAYLSASASTPKTLKKDWTAATRSYHQFQGGANPITQKGH